jgi:hypothetical protein
VSLHPPKAADTAHPVVVQMSGHYFWQCVEALSTTFDGDAVEAEANLEMYLSHCLQFPADRRLQRQRQIVQIIGGLAQLQTRLAELG